MTEPNVTTETTPAARRGEAAGAPPAATGRRDHHDLDPAVRRDAEWLTRPGNALATPRVRVVVRELLAALDAADAALRELRAASDALYAQAAEAEQARADAEAERNDARQSADHWRARWEREDARRADLCLKRDALAAQVDNLTAARADAERQHGETWKLCLDIQRERDGLRARAEAAERERDAARAKLAWHREHVAALYAAAGVLPRTSPDMAVAKVQGLREDCDSLRETIRDIHESDACEKCGGEGGGETGSLDVNGYPNGATCKACGGSGSETKRQMLALRNAAGVPPGAGAAEAVQHVRHLASECAAAKITADYWTRLLEAAEVPFGVTPEQAVAHVTDLRDRLSRTLDREQVLLRAMGCRPGEGAEEAVAHVAALRIRESQYRKERDSADAEVVELAARAGRLAAALTRLADGPTMSAGGMREYARQAVRGGDARPPAAAASDDAGPVSPPDRPAAGLPAPARGTGGDAPTPDTCDHCGHPREWHEQGGAGMCALAVADCNCNAFVAPDPPQTYGRPDPRFNDDAQPTETTPNAQA